MAKQHVSAVYSDITKPETKVPFASLKAFVRTNQAFANLMKGKVGKINGKQEEKGDDPTVLDLPTYKHLPDEFLVMSDSEKKEFIKSLCFQNPDIGGGDGQHCEYKRDLYIEQLFETSLSTLRNHLHMDIPEKFKHYIIDSVSALLDFMNIRNIKSDNEKLFHCSLLKAMFLTHIIRSSIDLESVGRINSAIRQRIQNHPNISEVYWDGANGESRIAYSTPSSQKPEQARITFGEKEFAAIFDKLARKPGYKGPEMLNDLGRINIEFPSESGNDAGRLWLINEICRIPFGDNSVNVEVNTKQGEKPIVALGLLEEQYENIKTPNIPDIHNIQVTGTLSRQMPDVRGINTFEVMFTVDYVNWNTEGIGNRSIYKVERLQQAFSRILTGGNGILKPGQVKYALQEVGKKLGLRETPEELLLLLTETKKILIPVNMLHGNQLCYRVSSISGSRPKQLFKGIEVEDLDIRDFSIKARLLKEFRRTQISKTSSPSTP